ncbi:MAG: HAMP domain-containing histidine kinase [Clostridia bacterium]|nr:HAMP domain-containing histidine kinase [Clostridia bacterium]
MHKRIFLRYYRVCAIIVFITVAVLGFVASVVIGVRTFNTQIDSMERAANKIAGTVADMPKNYYIIAGNIFDASISAVKETTRSEVLIYNSSGTLAISTVDVTGADSSLPSNAVLSNIMSGNTYHARRSFATGRPSVGYTVGVPVIMNDNKIGGAVFVTTSEMNVASTVTATLFVFIFCGVTVLAAAFVFIYFLTKRMMRPLYDMSAAAHSYAHGDFSKRIDVDHANEYAPLAIAFNAMADGMDNLEQVRRSFVTDVSHELRTPLTTISGFVDGMLDGTIPPELYNKYLTIVSEEARRVSRMVSSFLDVARIQSGQMTYVKKPFDIVKTAGKALFAFEDKINQGQITLNVGIPEDEAVIVNGDEDAIYRVIYNLLDNAVKFTPVGGEIRCTIEIDGEKAKITIRNTGCGISKEDAAHIFERFYKADKSRSINKKGTGIGLYLVKNIIKEHGEDIILTSKEGEFAQFMFSLPLYKD